MAKIVFIGDSITEYMPYIYKGSIGNPEDEVIYRGRENVGVGDCHKYMWPRIKEENADVYIILIGTNNLSRPDCDDDGRETDEELVLKIKEFINEVVGTGARLIVQSIYPTKYLSRNVKIKDVNTQIESYCNRIDVEYVDMYSLFESEDGFNKKYSDDGIHPNSTGYGVIAQVITQKLRTDKNKNFVKSEGN